MKYANNVQKSILQAPQMTSITFIIQYYYCWYWGLEGTEAERESGKKKKVENSSEKKKNSETVP